MKYSDKQRIQKIFEYTKKLLTHIDKNDITKEMLTNETHRNTILGALF